MFGLLLRVTGGAGDRPLRPLHTTVVVPHLELCAAVWDPYQLALSASLTIVQRRAAYADRRRHASLRLTRCRGILSAQELLKVLRLTYLTLFRQGETLQLQKIASFTGTPSSRYCRIFAKPGPVAWSDLHGVPRGIGNRLVIGTAALRRFLPKDMTECTAHRAGTPQKLGARKNQASLRDDEPHLSFPSLSFFCIY